MALEPHKLSYPMNSHAPGGVAGTAPAKSAPKSGKPDGCKPWGAANPMNSAAKAR